MRFIPVSSDGWRFILPLIVGGGGFIALGVVFKHAGPQYAGLVFLSLALFCLFFFRDFDRRIPQDDNVILCPADGRVLSVEKISGGSDQDGWLIRIFLSIFDVHVQRIPLRGKVVSVNHCPGSFLDARHPEAHIRNEKNTVVIQGQRGRVVVVQIAGLIARRIVCWIKPGDERVQGERYGLIRFGSQVDILLPSTVDIQVKEGDKVVGGVTSLALWSSTHAR